MPEYAAFLGHQPHISIVELAAVFPEFTLKNRFGKKIVTFECPLALGNSSIDVLGGTIAIAERITESAITIEDIPHLLATESEKTRGKVTFSLRTHGLSPKQVRELQRLCKAALKKRGRTCRYLGSDHKIAAAAAVHEAGLITGKGGVDLTILASEEDLWVGRTTGLQDIDAYTKRDVGKPVRDKTVGLMPPKLAQIVLNLGLWATTYHSKPAKNLPKKFKPATAVVLDPFCGTGVIPVECLLRNCPVLASDKAAKAVKDTQANLDWLRKEYKITKGAVPDKVLKHDATKPFTYKNLPDVIVTETSLGPNIESRPSQQDAKKHRKENELLQKAFLENCAATLPGVPIVCTWPVWRTKTEPYFLEQIWKELEELPYEAVLPIELEHHTRPTLFYRRSDQYVGREIVILVSKQ